MSHRNTLFPPAAGNTETVDFSYPILNRRQFLLRTAALAGATSLLVLPRKLTATSLLFTPASSARPPALLKNSIGFNGQRQDPVTGLYHLGQGYRAYNPQMMRFHAADNLSPFGAGGFNPYAYALGDPINLIDPTGHISWKGIAGIVLGYLGLVTSLGIVVATISMGLPFWMTGLASVAFLAAVVALGAGIEAIIRKDENPELSERLENISLIAGVVSLFLVVVSVAL